MPYKENLEKGDYMNIFISYSHIDKEFALKLSSALEADGYDVFIDNKIPIGNNIYKDIEYSCAVTPQVRQTGNRLSGLAGTAYASLLT